MSVFPQIFPVFLPEFFSGTNLQIPFDAFSGFLAVWQSEQSTAHCYPFSGITAKPTLVSHTELVP